MSIVLSPTPKMQFFDDDGVPLAGGLLYTYKAGTTTPLSTFTDSSGSSSNTNPITLDAAGRANIWLDSALAYKFILKTVIGTTIYTVDNITGSGSGGSGTITSTSIVNNIAALKSLTVSSGNQYATVLGYTSALDEGGGSFLYDATSSATADDGMVVLPSSSPASGRWLRITDNTVINVAWYGAKGDNSTNNTTAFSAAQTYANAQSPKFSLYVPSGIYVLTTDPGLTLPVKLAPDAIIKVSAYNLGINPIITDNNQHFTLVNNGFVTMSKTITEIHPEWFGAKGDGSLTTNVAGTNDTSAIQSAIDCAPIGSWVVFDSTKKYWCGSLVLKSGVNIKGTQSKMDSIYRSTLCYNSTGGDLLALTGSTVQGVIIRDIILDGMTSAANILYSNTSSGMIIQDCTIRNADTLVLMGASDNYTIERSVFSGASIYAISANGGEKGRIRNNVFVSCTNSCINIAGPELVDISGNEFQAIVGTGIRVLNNTANCPCNIYSNTITGGSTAGCIGIEITGTASNHINITGNLLHQPNNEIGTAIVADDTLPGTITNNTVTGTWVTYYDIGSGTVWSSLDAGALMMHNKGIGGFTADGVSWTIKADSTAKPTYLADYGAIYMRSTDSSGYQQAFIRSSGDQTTGWKPIVTQTPYFQIKDGPAFNMQVGKTDIIPAFDSGNAALAVIKDEQLSNADGAYTLLHSFGGVNKDSSSVMERSYLYLDSTADGTASIINGIALENVAVPYTNLKSFTDRRFDGNFIFGQDSTTLVTLGDKITPTEQIQTNPLPTKGCVNAALLNTGLKKVWTNISAQEEGLKYYVTDGVVHARIFITDDNIVYPETTTLDSTTTGTTSLDGLGTRSFTASTGLSYPAGRYVILSDATDRSDFSTHWHDMIRYQWCKVISYDSGTGAMVVDVKYSRLRGSASISNFTIFCSWPWYLSDQQYSQPISMRNLSPSILDLNPIEWTSMGYDGIRQQTISLLVNLSEDVV